MSVWYQDKWLGSNCTLNLTQWSWKLIQDAIHILTPKSDSMELETYTRRNTYFDSKISCVYIETKICMDERAISQQHLKILLPDTQISYLIGEMRMDLLL